LTDDLREKWNIEAEDLFDIYYDTPEKLLNAFEDNTTDLHPKRDRKNAVQHRTHLKYVWQVIDESSQIFPRIAFSNVRLVQDMYHNKTRQLVGKGGVEASTLKVRIGSLRKFLIFLRSQGIFAGISRKQIQTLLESLSDWNDQLKKLVGQRKVAIRKFKQRQLMTAKHLIAYGRSTFVQSLIKKLNLLENSDSVAFSTGFATDIRGYFMVNLCAMNGLRNSNLCNLQLEDVENYTLDPKYPGHMIVSNDDYKTSTIYGEKLIVIPKCIYKHVLLYIKYLRPKISKKKSKYLFITSSPNNEMMSSADVGAALTASFLKATVFDKDEYNRVSPTRMRVACATIACNTEGVDMGFFANVFMKNRKETTAWHYNVLANNRDALSMAMMIGNSFQVGDQEVVVNQEQVAEMTKAMTTASLPSREDVVKWFKENSDFIDSSEKQNILEILEELGQPKSLTCSNTGTFYPKKLVSDKNCVGSDDNDDGFDDYENDSVDNDIASEYEQLDDFNIDTTVSTGLHKRATKPLSNDVIPQSPRAKVKSLCDIQNMDTKKHYPTRKRKSRINTEFMGVEDDVKDQNYICEENDSLSDSDQGVTDPLIKKVNIGESKILDVYNQKKPHDIIHVRKLPRSTYLALTHIFKELILRKDQECGVTTFTEKEMQLVLNNSPNKLLKSVLVALGKDLKYNILIIRKKYKKIKASGNCSKLLHWFKESEELYNNTLNG